LAGFAVTTEGSGFNHLDPNDRRCGSSVIGFSHSFEETLRSVSFFSVVFRIAGSRSVTLRKYYYQTDAKENGYPTLQGRLFLSAMHPGREIRTPHIIHSGGDLDAELLLRKRKSLKREWSQRPGLMEKRIAVLGGSTTQEVVDLLGLLLLRGGIDPIFYQSEYNRYFEDAVVDPAALTAFQPDIVYLHTSSACVRHFPSMGASEPEFDACLELEMERYRAIWDALQNNLSAVIVQNNFEPLPHQLLGNLDFASPAGRVRFINSLNSEFAREARTRSRLLINDMAMIAARLGLNRFHDARRYFSYKLVTTPEGSLEIARSVDAIVRAVYGRTRKCLVLDLDNTLWGGTVGDDGIEKIKIGRETPEAEAYMAFQEYCLAIRGRGIILAVCSKNDEAMALRILRALKRIGSRRTGTFVR
jgi:predicted enzyme involved in methoxymalonyl-ACP biosynthesis